MHLFIKNQNTVLSVPNRHTWLALEGVHLVVVHPILVFHDQRIHVGRQTFLLVPSHHLKLPLCRPYLFRDHHDRGAHGRDHDAHACPRGRYSMESTSLTT